MKIERSIHIDAAPERVWQVMSDVERWPEWTPSTKSVKRDDAGPLRVGSSARVELRGAPTATWVVTELEEGRGFWWVSRATPPVAGGHFVAADGEGSRATLTIAPRGVFGTIMSPLIVWLSRKNVEAEAAGLKRRSEEAVTNA